MLYKFIDENIIEAQPQSIVITKTLTETIDEEETTRDVEFLVVNPTDETLIQKEYKELVVEEYEVPENDYYSLNSYYVDGDVITKKTDVTLFTDEQIAEIEAEREAEAQRQAEYEAEQEALRQEQEAQAEVQRQEVERVRINNLYLTKADVLLALYNDKGITPEQIKTMLADNQEALIRFEYASNYYRGDDTVVALGEALGYTTEQLDCLFINKTFEVTENA